MFNIFKKKAKIKPSEHSMKVHNFDTNGGVVDDFGMTKKRALYLLEKTLEIYNNSRTKTAAAAKISEYCNHPNELAFCCMFIGEHYVRLQEDSLKKLIDIIRK